MVKGTRVIIMKSDKETSEELRAVLYTLNGVTIAAELDNPAYLDGYINEFSAEVVVIDLDHKPQAALNLIKETAAKHPETSIFALSREMDSQLILTVLRHGAREFLARPLDQVQVTEAFVRTAKRHRGSFKRGKVICFVGAAGGSGSTTLATNLGCELASLTPQRAVLVDMDFLGGHVASLLDISAQYSITDLCGGEGPVELTMIEQALVRHQSGLFVLTSPNRYIKNHQMTLERSAMVINLLANHFGYVICDGISRGDAATHAILDITNSVFLVIQLVINSIHNAERFIGKLEAEGFDSDRVEVVINRYTREHSELHPEDAEKNLNRKIPWVLPSDWKTVIHSANVGQPFTVDNPKAKISESLRRMALAIHDPEAFAKTGDALLNPQTKRGLWQKIRGKG